MTDILLEHFSLRRHPFTNEIDADAFHGFQSFQQGFLRLEQILPQRGAALVVGEPGAGKTALVRYFIRRLAPSSFVVLDQVISPGPNPIKPAIEGLLTLLGEPIPFNNPARSLRRLKQCIQAIYEKRQTPVVILDDVQHLTEASWLTMKSLMNYDLDSKSPLLFVLMGARQDTLRQLSLSSLTEVRDRLAFCFHLKGLKSEEVEGYLEKRLKWAGAAHPLFPTAIAEQIGRHAQGLPRRINRLANACLLAAASDKRNLIDQDCLDRAISETQFQAPRREEEER